MTSGRPWLNRVLRPYRLVLLAVIVALGCFEVGLRAVRWPENARSGWLAHSIEGPFNEVGYRGRPFRDSESLYRCHLLLLGDSQVECRDCAQRAIPEVVLEQAFARRGLRVQVVSVGAEGYGQDQELLGLENFYAAGGRAETVLLWQTIQNDIWNNEFPTHWPGYTDGPAKPTFWFFGNTLLGPTEYIGDYTFHSALIGLILQAFKIGRDELWERYLLPASSPGSMQPPQNLPVHMLLTSEDLQKEKSHFAIFREDRSPRLDYGIRLTRALLSRIEHMARQHGAKFVIFQEGRIAVEARELPAGNFLLASGGLYFHGSVSSALQHRDQIDAGFNFFEIPIRVQEPWVSYWNRHLNSAGNEDVLDQLAERLIDSGIIGANSACN